MSGRWSCFAYQCTAGKSMLWHLPGPPQFNRNLLWDTHFNTVLSILFAPAFLGNQKVSWWNSMKENKHAPKAGRALFYKKPFKFQCFNFKLRDYFNVSPAEVWSIITTQKKMNPKKIASIAQFIHHLGITSDQVIPSVESTLGYAILR